MTPVIATPAERINVMRQRFDQVLAVVEGDPHRAASIRDWADDLAALAKSEAA